MNGQAARFIGLLIAALLAISACGGSSGGGGAAPPPPPPPPPPIGGITRTGVAFAVGPITAFGSVVVNGITYDTSSAEFTVDGQPAFQTDLGVGDMVLVKGTIDDDNTNAVAESVEFDDNVEGPVTSVTTGTNTMVVLGQTVTFGDAIFDDNCPANRNDLLTVAAVEVSGQVIGGGTIDATRIECKNVLGEMEVTGIVSGLGMDTFMINDLVVNFTSFPAAIDNFPTPGVIGEGDPVEVKGNSFVAGTDDLIATRVEFKGNRFDDNEGDHMEIEGFINGFMSELEFNVGITPVTTIPGTTIYEGGSVDDLGDNLKVEVEGEFDDAGVLNATKVEIKQATTVRLTAQVDSVTIVEREDLDSEAIIQGFIETNGVNRPLITVLGDTIETNGATIFKNDDDSVIPDPDDFWNAISAGSLIKAKGMEDMARPRTLIAEEVEIQNE